MLFLLGYERQEWWYGTGLKTPGRGAKGVLPIRRRGEVAWQARVVAAGARGEAGRAEYG